MAARQSAGKALTARIRADLKAQGLEPDPREEELLTLAEGIVDRMVELDELIAKDGLRTVSDSGMIRLHPAVAEHRQHVAALARVLAGIALDEAPAKDPQKLRAAQARWRDHAVGSTKKHTS